MTLVGAQSPATSAVRLHLDRIGELTEPYFADGLFFVPLASITAAELVLSAIAEALALTFSGAADLKAQLLNYLRPRRLLLALDSFEMLQDVVDLLIEILATAPATKLLVTSRERLNLQEEWVIEVNALAFPQRVAGPQGNELETLEAYGAVQLFVQRARRVQTGFQLKHDEGAHVARICQLVGGMPLGLELAATWLRVLSCREIAQEIAQNLDFLATSLRNIPERHRSLRAVFEQSWQMLTEQEQAPIYRSIFAPAGAPIRAPPNGFTSTSPSRTSEATYLYCIRGRCCQSGGHCPISVLARWVRQSYVKRAKNGYNGAAPSYTIFAVQKPGF